MEALCAGLPAPALQLAGQGEEKDGDDDGAIPQAPPGMVPVPQPLEAVESEKQRSV